MDEKIIEISFNIIGYAGEGKGLAFEAIKEAKNGNIEKAKELIGSERVGAHVNSDSINSKEIKDSITEN